MPPCFDFQQCKLYVSLCAGEWHVESSKNQGKNAQLVQFERGESRAAFTNGPGFLQHDILHSNFLKMVCNGQCARFRANCANVHPLNGLKCACELWHDSQPSGI